MSAPQLNPSEEDGERRRIRKAWWWTIYLIGSVGVPFLTGIYNLTAHHIPRFSIGLILGGFVMLVLWLVMLPIGLALDFGNLLAACWQRQLHPDIGLVEGMAWVLKPVAYFVFGMHLSLTLSAKSNRVFLLLMLSLVLLLSASLVGCREEINRPLGLQ